MNGDSGCGYGYRIFIVVISCKIGNILFVAGSRISKFIFGTVVISSVSFSVKNDYVIIVFIRTLKSVKSFFGLFGERTVRKPLAVLIVYENGRFGR